MDMWHVSQVTVAVWSVCLVILIGSAEIPNVNWPQNPEVQWTLGNSFSGSLARHGFRFFKNKLESVKKQFCWEAQKSSNHFFCCFRSICEICCDYVFGSPLKNWDRLLLYLGLPALRRLLALSRGLGLPIPKPFRAPFIPGITVRTERRNGRRWDNEKFVLQFCNIFFEGRSLVQRENYPLMEGVMTLYRVLGCQVHVEIAGFLGLVFDDGWCQLIHERWPRVYRCSVEHPKFSLFIVVSYWSTCTFDCLCMGVHLKIHQDTVDIASDHQLKDSLVMIYNDLQ